MNKLMIIGNLTRDPELRTANTADGQVSVCSFSVAVNSRRGRNGQEDTTFFNVTAWRALGENCAKYLAKGRKVCVVGPVSARTYQANDGSTRVSLDVQANEVEFLSSRNDDGAQSSAYGTAAPAYSAPAAASAPTAQNSFTAVEPDELPF